MKNPQRQKKPRGTGLTYDGMRRCQRLPELRTPLIPRDALNYIKCCARLKWPISEENTRWLHTERPMPGTT